MLGSSQTWHKLMKHFFYVKMLLYKKNGKILLCLPESLQTLLYILKKYFIYKTKIFILQE